MTKARLAAIGVSLAALAFGAYRGFNPEPSLAFSVLEQIAYEIVLAPEALHPYRDRLGADLAVTAAGRPLLLLDDDVIELTGRSDDAIDAAKVSSGVKARHFAVDQTGAVWVATDEALGRIEPGGFRSVIALPMQWGDARLVVSDRQRTIFVYGGAHGPNEMRGGIVAVRANGDTEFLVESPELPIVAVAATPRGLVVATAHDILYLEQHDLHLVTRTNGDAKIVSVAYSAPSNTLFYSTAGAVYAMKGLAGVAIAQGLGGELAYARGSLYVLDRVKAALVRLDGVDQL
jgi:hypothetical protein